MVARSQMVDSRARSASPAFRDEATRGHARVETMETVSIRALCRDLAPSAFLEAIARHTSPGLRPASNVLQRSFERSIAGASTSATRASPLTRLRPHARHPPPTSPTRIRPAAGSSRRAEGIPCVGSGSQPTITSTLPTSNP